MLDCISACEEREELVKAGASWWYASVPGDTVLEGLENEARESKKGLWADPQPVPPWEWRDEGVPTTLTVCLPLGSCLA